MLKLSILALLSKICIIKFLVFIFILFVIQIVIKINRKEVISMSKPKHDVTKLKILQSRVKESDYKLFMEKAEDLGLSISSFIRLALKEYCRNH